jgi:hypothetical protein
VLLRDAEDIAPEWQWRTEREEAEEEERLRREDAGLGLGPSWRDDEWDDAMFVLATRKLRNEMALKHLDDLPKTGRPAGGSGALDRYRALAQACLDKAHGNESAAKRAFIRRMEAENRVGDSRATVLWYKVTKRVGAARRVG